MLNEGINDNSGVWLQPLRAAVFTQDREKGAMTRSAAIGTQWTQSRVALAGYATSKEDDKCRLCESATGTLRHRFARDGCPVLQEQRNDWMRGGDDSIIQEIQPKMLETHGFLLNSEIPNASCKPAIEKQHWYESDVAIDLGDRNYRRKTFSGDTFADGSCVACMENDDLTQCGWAVVSMQSSPSDSVRDRAENPDAEGPRCTCREARNHYHRCVRECAELNGCDGKCFAKKADQKRVTAPVLLALYGVLPGFDQTTPRAELYAIYQAVRYGCSPQRIIVDHINHVNALNDWMINGITSFLNPKTPNLDLWRLVYDQINKRGGLSPSGPNLLCFVWQPSHTRAHDGETAEQKFLRRGNDAADVYANWGRMLNVDISEVKKATQVLFSKAKAWALWIGHASYLQYAKEWSGCDHDLKPKGAAAKPKNQKQEVKVPVEAKVIRRMPWARSSLGTIEYLEDLWQQDGVDEQFFASPIPQFSRCTSIEKSYIDKFRRTVGQDSSARGVRFVPKQVTPELSEVLPTSASMGHHIMTAGIKPKQYFWCELCSAYTGQRARKLTKDCDRITRNVPAVEALRKGTDPHNGVQLDTMPRRLIKRDVGNHLWSGEGRPDDNLASFSFVGSDEPGAVLRELASLHADEDDPLGLGCGLD